MKLFSPKQRTGNLFRESNRALTLVETMVTVSIVATLVALSIGGYNRAFEKASAASAISIYRGIGTAMANYLGDNENMYPGPLRNTQFAQKYDEFGLFYHLAPYLEIGDLKDKDVITKIVPKAFYRQGDPKVQSPFYLNTFLIRSDGSEFTPWGYSGNTISPTPSKMFSVLNPSQQVALIDMDAKLPTPFGPGIGNGPYTVKEPIHGNQRIALYHDWHVGSIPLNENFYMKKLWK